jgi:hypothetical protein
MKPELSQPLAKLELVLESLALGRATAIFLSGAARISREPIPTEVKMTAPGNTVQISGTHCGFFTTSVLHSAMLDVRKTLAFLRLRFDKNMSAIESATKPGGKDDLFITDLGLQAPSPQVLFEMSIRVIGKPATTALVDVCRYTNKELAHFSIVRHEPDWSSIVDATGLMREAILVFVFDALSIPRPLPRLNIHELG